jgi:hypothetical protein
LSTTGKWIAQKLTIPFGENKITVNPKRKFIWNRDLDETPK